MSTGSGFGTATACTTSRLKERADPVRFSQRGGSAQRRRVRVVTSVPTGEPRGRRSARPTLTAGGDRIHIHDLRRPDAAISAWRPMSLGGRRSGPDCDGPSTRSCRSRIGNHQRLPAGNPPCAPCRDRCVEHVVDGGPQSSVAVDVIECEAGALQRPSSLTHPRPALLRCRRRCIEQDRERYLGMHLVHGERSVLNPHVDLAKLRSERKGLLTDAKAGQSQRDRSGFGMRLGLHGSARRREED